LGVPWKIKIDSLHDKAIVDLKVMRDMEDVWVDGQGKISFIEAWGYDLQGAIYQAVTGGDIPFILAVATKEKPEPDIALIEIAQSILDTASEIIEVRIERFAKVKAGTEEPIRCEKCDWCKMTKKLTGVVRYEGIE
jgi:hypothetical protein